MKKPIIAANWKLNKGPEETVQFFREFLAELKAEDQAHFLFFPPAINAVPMQQALAATKISWGLQNVHWEGSGAYTGENSAQILKDLGGTHVLIGHSERRQLFGETDLVVSQKVAFVQTLGLTPVVCVGESLEQRESGQTKEVIQEQLKAVLKNANASSDLMIAYEPVWAIGTGKTATPEQANEAHQVLRSEIESQWGVKKAQETPILYGGSVKPNSAKALSSQPEIDGFLIGGASLQPKTLLEVFGASE